MKIEICDGDRLLHEDSKDRLVIVKITTTSGKIILLPCSADQTIADLCGSLQNKLGEFLGGEHPVAIKSGSVAETAAPGPPLRDTRGIQRGDTVIALRDIGDEGGGPGIVTGRSYRVMEISKKKDMPTVYELVDDSAGTRERIAVYATDIYFSKRAEPKAPKVMKFEKISPCPQCKESVALTKEDDGLYRGKCVCGFSIQELAA